MATKDDRPGLLSKVAMFVRNPTKDWSELDQNNEGDGGGYDKAALKAMIERKRQNDFVRKREFDQLRRLRNRDPGAMAGMGRQSFFQTSLPSDIGGRADTLKKIDEIEAQMSRQWWKSKNDNAPAQNLVFPSPDATQPPPDLPSSEMFPSDSDLSAPFPPTEPVGLRPAEGLDFGDEFLPTQMASGMVSMPGNEMPGAGAALSEANGMFSTSRLFAIELDAPQTDPELEEAAIRFANGDDAIAEKGLLAALRNGAPAGHLAQTWAAALLDLYRATDNRPGFEAAVHEFAQSLEGVRPVWFALGEQALSDEAATAEVESCIWNSPANLTAQGMESLRQSMESSPMPWHLSWRALDTIAADAIPLLDALFGSLCEERVSLRFDGEDRLVRALRAITPAGQSGVAQSFWDTRLNALRAMQLHDDFELASLDYCVTFGAAPPPWVPAACSVELSGGPAGSRRHPERDAVTQPGGLDSGQSLPVARLQGALMGDTAQALSELDAIPQYISNPVISCRDLVRVDFAAAGSILNWATLRHAEGRQVQFLDVHRLVAAFFNVIGIHERAKVILRAI